VYWRRFRCAFVAACSYVRQLAEESPESATTGALTQFIIRNAVSLAERCVSKTADHAAINTCAARRGKRSSKASHTILDRFLNQVCCAATFRR